MEMGRYCKKYYTCDYIFLHSRAVVFLNTAHCSLQNIVTALLSQEQRFVHLQTIHFFSSLFNFVCLIRQTKLYFNYIPKPILISDFTFTFTFKKLAAHLEGLKTLVRDRL